MFLFRSSCFLIKKPLAKRQNSKYTMQQIWMSTYWVFGPGVSSFWLANQEIWVEQVVWELPPISETAKQCQLVPLLPSVIHNIFLSMSTMSKFSWTVVSSPVWSYFLYHKVVFCGLVKFSPASLKAGYWNPTQFNLTSNTSVYIKWV